MGPPKINKKASKKNKKSWRKNIDITDVEEALEEQRFEERVGGSFSERDSKDLFMLDTSGTLQDETASNKKKEPKTFKCFSLLEGLPGAPDPAPQRDRVRSSEERMNPIVKKKKEHLQNTGFISKKERLAKTNRENHQEKKLAGEVDRKTRRRMKFDFDLWGEEEKTKDGDEWVGKETKIHTDTWTSKLVPKQANNRMEKAKTLLPAVEVPHPGQSYNPSLSDHQDVLWKAAMVELDKEKEQKRLERLTTAMYPKKGEAPTMQTYIKEMSAGIPELQDGSEEKDEDSSEDEDGEEAGQHEDQETETEKVDGATPFKPKTRKQRRDMKRTAKKEWLLKAKKLEKSKEDEVFTIKSMKKDIAKKEKQMEERQKKKAEKAIEKLKNPLRLSNYKYQPQEIEIKLSDELTGKLRNLKAEGSILEDRYKSLQRRNLVETRVIHHAKKKKKVKVVDKRSHKMGFEDELRQLKNKKIQKQRSRAKNFRMKKKTHS
eukprot:TRINITY_DN23269_c0_g1_i2.p1 TRINITY_DN23269_c0_g1~~TRINITY_DN23269_c0_g1_i2.p1  ORF type:complete len:505 (+),score=163.88 TRINITY_DN23269_c0_g1_i2:52-1515(+)